MGTGTCTTLENCYVTSLCMTKLGYRKSFETFVVITDNHKIHQFQHLLFLAIDNELQKKQSGSQQGFSH